MKPLILLFPLLLLFTSCRSTGYAVKEKFGIEKRDILVKDVEQARDSQSEAQEQFASALDQFQSVVDVDGGDLEKKYRKLDKEFTRSEERARDVRKRIDDVEQVSRDLFREWKKELDLYQNDELRRASADQLRQTQDQFEDLLATMRRAEAKMDPVLAAFRDQVLFLKHNLNSRAIASIRTEASNIQNQIEDLIRDMNASIVEADAFIKQMDS